MRVVNPLNNINRQSVALVFAAACAACLACAACSPYVDVQAQTRTKTVDKTVPLPVTGSVTLETHNGSLDVSTWDRSEIEIHARIETAGITAGDARRFDQTSVDVSSTPDSVRIVSRFPDFIWTWFGESNPTISYTITAPRTARWTIRGHNFRADIRDLRAALDVGTHNGSLRASNLDGPLEVRGHNESVTVDFASFRGADITTHNGTAELSLPKDSKFDLRADTRYARVDSDFPLLTHTLGRRQGSVDGTVNGGGSPLRFSAHSGHLRLKAK